MKSSPNESKSVGEFQNSFEQVSENATNDISDVIEELECEIQRLKTEHKKVELRGNILQSNNIRQKFIY